MLRPVFSFVLFFTLVSGAAATPIDSYRARLSDKDHFNSTGTQLNSAAAIIRQDRANFYIFGNMDPEDESDTFFNDKANRARLEKMLLRGQLSAEHMEVIVNGTPLIRIDIHADHIEVFVEEH
ncbi:hypothetical protein [Pseudochrobactrum sp. MP213Fo]|uniref:hypothetical protein n=1 Tax=Pseudochrobactrum sp. MP213Fo TaxID=3022250 RepID=UPI003BA191EA